jgi:hypothetical protein
MQKRCLPSFFLARTIGELQGLSDGSITPSASILSTSSSMIPCINGFRGRYRCFTGSGCRRRISCWASGVSPRTVSNRGSFSARNCRRRCSSSVERVSGGLSLTCKAGSTGAENLDGPGALVAEVSRLSTPPTQGGGRLLSWGWCSGGSLRCGGSFCWGWSGGWPAGRHRCGGGLLVCLSGGPPHGRGSFAERTVSGGRLSGRGKGGSKQTICTKKGVLVPGGAGTLRGRCP